MHRLARSSCSHLLWVAAAVALLLAACSPPSTDESALGKASGDDCLVIEVVASPEKLELVTDLAQGFNRIKREVNGRCVFVNPRGMTSGAATNQLAGGWDAKTVGPPPVIWAPASSMWGAILDQRLAEQSDAPMARVGTPFVRTPLVIAMPRPMAEALGWPSNPIGWADIADLATDDQGWASRGHPEWGAFRLGKTNPEVSTSGLASLVAQSYAAAGKVSGLSTSDLSSSSVLNANRDVESAVVHYGGSTTTFLDNWLRADLSGTATQYLSALVVEEKSVLDYNAGNPDGILQPDEKPLPPLIPLVAIYPEEGTIYSDHPFFVLDAPWVSDTARAGARLFGEYVQRPENQERALGLNFRPGDQQLPLRYPIDPINGADPNQPRTVLEVPEPEVMAKLIDHWHEVRRDARVLLVVDVSASMGERASPDSPATKLELATRAAADSLDQLDPDDQLGLRRFSTGLGADGQALWIDETPVGSMSAVADRIARELKELTPANQTPLYEVALASVQAMYDQYDPNRINAVVLLTDGREKAVANGTADGEADAQMADAIQAMSALTKGSRGRPIRLFPIAYGPDANLSVLRQMAAATGGRAYNASDPRTIGQVLTAVFSNF